MANTDIETYWILQIDVDGDGNNWQGLQSTHDRERAERWLAEAHQNEAFPDEYRLVGR